MSEEGGSRSEEPDGMAEKEQLRLRQESEDLLKQLRMRLEAERMEECDRLEAQKNQEMERLQNLAELELQAAKERLEELRESAQKQMEREEQTLREENLNLLKELRDRLEAEREAERRRLEAQKVLEMDRLQAELDRELQAERRKLQEETEDKRAAMKKADALQEAPDDLQHEDTVEMLRLDHVREMNSIRQKFRDEESAERQQLLSSLQEERERLQAAHAAQLENLRFQFDKQVQEMKLEHSLMESTLQMELRANEAADLRRQKLEEPKDEADGETESLDSLRRERDLLKEELQRVVTENQEARGLLLKAKEGRDMARKEEQRLRRERDKAIEESLRATVEKELLEKRLEHLEKQWQHHSRASLHQHLHQEAGDAEGTKSSGENSNSSLHMEELGSFPSSHLPGAAGSIDGARRYTSQDAVIQQAKLFLKTENEQVLERHRAQRQSQTCSLLPNQEEGLTEERQMGQPPFEGLSQLPAAKKVTFDISESDLSSTVDAQGQTGGQHPVPPELTKSLKKISGKINTVLSVLGSMSQHQSTTQPYLGFPQAPSQSDPTLNSSPSFPVLPQVQVPDHHSSALPPSLRLSDSWSRIPQASVAVGPLFSTPISHVLKARAPMDPFAHRKPPSLYSPYRTSSAHGPDLQSVHGPVETSSHRLEQLMSSNKRWLENRRKDGSIPLFTHLPAPLAENSKVQLGLDDDDQIRVYYY
eukprot:XP_011607100.1 PREDICTED: trichohyalin-like [Takifugu rubripes]